MKETRFPYRLVLLCIAFFWQAQSLSVHAQEKVQSKRHLQASHRNEQRNQDSTLLMTATPSEPDLILASDSFLLAGDSLALSIETEVFRPDPKKALWYAVLCPGLGQVYNRKYWKLPIVAGAAVGLAYAVSWNGKYYATYTLAYRDLTDNDPNTNSFMDLNYGGSTAQLNTLLKNRQQKFRRQRDLSIIGAIGTYLICILDAYVDAELFDFNVSPDLSFQIQPELKPNSMPWEPAGSGCLNVSCCFRF